MWEPRHFTCFSAPTSLVPSPHINVILPTVLKVVKISSFCSGATRAKTWKHTVIKIYILISLHGDYHINIKILLTLMWGMTLRTASVRCSISKQSPPMQRSWESDKASTSFSLWTQLTSRNYDLKITDIISWKGHSFGSSKTSSDETK